jgi:hypothetical protein
MNEIPTFQKEKKGIGCFLVVGCSKKRRKGGRKRVKE